MMDRSDADPSSAEMALCHAALAHYKAGRNKEAAAMCHHLLDRNRDHPHALLLLGLILADGTDPAAGSALIERYLVLVPTDRAALYGLGMIYQRRDEHEQAVAVLERAVALHPGFVQAIHGLGVSYLRLRRLDAAEAALERAMSLAPCDPVICNNLGELRLAQGHLADALASFEQAASSDPDLAAAHFNRGIILTRLDRWRESIPAFRRAVALDPTNLEASRQLAEALENDHQPHAAQACRNDIARRRGITISPCLGKRAAARVLLLYSAGWCDVPTDCLFDTQRFELISVYLLARDAAGPDQATLLERLPSFDVCFNAIGDADGGAPFLSEAIKLCGDIRRPVLNAPERIAGTRRDRMAALLDGIPCLAVPRTTRCAKVDIPALLDELRRPLLVRPAGSHGGHDLERIEQARELDSYLDPLPYSEYYVTPYSDVRSRDGYFRKYRFIFVDREVFPYHLAIMDHWKVHYWRADMDAARWMRDEEEMFLADYRTIFPGALGEAVREIARRLDLDFAGLDCTITADGTLFLFEANANMLVHLYDSIEAAPYKHQYVPRIFDAISRLVERHAQRP